jgi:hypothetical protein
MHVNAAITPDHPNRRRFSQACNVRYIGYHEASTERIWMLDELFYDPAHFGWMVPPWTPDGFGIQQDAIIEEHEEKLLDKRNVYSCNAIVCDGACHVKQIGEVIASDV